MEHHKVGMMKLHISPHEGIHELEHEFKEGMERIEPHTKIKVRHDIFGHHKQDK